MSGGRSLLQLEKEVYEKLKELREILIPQLYGQGSFNWVPALNFSDVAGITLYDLAHNKIKVQEKTSATRLIEGLRILYEHGAEHWGQKLSNSLFCDNGDCDDGKVIDRSRECPVPRS